MIKFFLQRCSRLKIFISYSRADKKIASDIAQVLRNKGDEIFFDEDSLPPGSDFNDRIATAINASDRFIFLISPSSMRFDSFAQQELRLAQRKWPVPVNKVWPVALDRDQKITDVDSYLRSVNILTTEGNLPLNLASEIDASRKVAATCWLVSVALLSIVISASAWALWPLIGPPSGKVLTFMSPVRVGHWTGAPSLIVRTLVNNTGKENIRINELRAFVSGPDNRKRRLDAEGVVANFNVTPFPEFFFPPNEKWTGDYAFINAPAELITLHQKIYKRFASTPEAFKPWDPTANLIEGDLLDEIVKNTNKHFYWVPGHWKIEIHADINGVRTTSKFEFDLSKDDIEIIQGASQYYPSGAGVMPNWRFAGQAVQAYRLIDAEFVE